MTATINHKLIKADSNQGSFCSVKHYISPCRSHSLLLHQLTSSWSKKRKKKISTWCPIQAVSSTYLPAAAAKHKLLLLITGGAAGTASTTAASTLSINTRCNGTVGLSGLVCWIYLFNISEYVSALLLLGELPVPLLSIYRAAWIQMWKAKSVRYKQL